MTVEYLTKKESEKIINEIFEKPDVKIFLQMMDWRDKLVAKNPPTKLNKSDAL